MLKSQVRRFMMGGKDAKQALSFEVLARFICLFKRLALTTTAFAALTTSVVANVYEGQLASYSDQQVLQFLVSEHARNPSTFGDAHAYIVLHRPEIVEEYLNQTLGRAPDTRSVSFSESSAGIGSMIILGIVGMSATISLADDGGSENSDPGPSQSPSPPSNPVNPEPEPEDPPVEPEPEDPPAEPEPEDPPAEPDNYTGGYLYNDSGTLIELTSERDFEEIETLAAAVSKARSAATFVAQQRGNNWANSAIKLEYARGAGLTGAGQTIAIFDDGFRFSHDEFAAVDRTVTNVNNAVVDSHGTLVASIAAGSDDFGKIEGVAPNANLRLFGWGSMGDEPIAWEASIADAAEHGAIVHNNSWILVASISAGKSVFTSQYRDGFEEDLIDYTRKAVVVFAADNISHRSDSTYLAALPVVIPELEQGWLAVINLLVPYDAASDRFGTPDRVSSACWEAARWCIGADGSVGRAASSSGDSAYSGGGGTSSAAPQVSGAIALLAEAFPNLSAPQLRNRLLATADNSFFEHTHTLEFEGSFSHGYNEEFGHGLMDLRAALLPIGTLSTTTASGEQLVFGKAAIVGGGASGDALVKGLTNLPALSTDQVAGDFRLNAASFVRQASWSNPLPLAAFSVERANLARDRNLTRLRAQRTRPSLDVLTPSRFYGAENSLESYRGILLPVYIGEAQHIELLIPGDSEGDIGFEASYLRQFDRSAITLGLSSIYDTDGVLGMTSTGTSDPLESVSTSLNLSWSLPLNERSSFQVSGKFGLTDARAGGLIGDFSRLRYASYQVAYDRADTFQQGSTLTLFVQRPTRIESGTASVELASGRNSNNELTYTQYDIDMSPSSHQVNFGFDYRTPLGNQAEIHLGMLHSTNAGHVSGETSTAGLFRVQWRF
ncbi:S8 family peptidase [uncultured Tateyamaria sp.]|uniref:S8 family peptidase n=1 Tax=uncultured Tateyamaria sp. TaxID=455651 RepID=UPI00261C6FAE|nr:S8 family peptidase [uncultured Tateyamaria sp.]